MSPPLVYVIVLNYNASDWLESCLQTLTTTDYENFKVLFIDNASTDSSIRLVKRRFPGIEVIANQVNLGFSAGNNIGINVALSRSADYVVLLNPDTKIKPNWLKEVVRVGEMTSEIGVLGAVQLCYDSDCFNSWTLNALKPYLNELAAPDNARWHISVDWIEGSCFAIKRRVLEDIGGLDPIYSSFYEEIDFCRRAACKGYQTVVVPRSQFHHYRGGVWQSNAKLSRQRDYLCDRSQFIYHLTDPRASLFYNLQQYFVTLGSKIANTIRMADMSKAWDLVKIQMDILCCCREVWSKWRKDRSNLCERNTI